MAFPLSTSDLIAVQVPCIVSNAPHRPRPVPLANPDSFWRAARRAIKPFDEDGYRLGRSRRPSPLGPGDSPGWEGMLWY